MTPALKREWPALILFAALGGVTTYTWRRAGDRVPVHFTLAGHADAYGTSAHALLAIPIAAIVLYALLLLWPRVDPRGRSFEGFARTFRTVRLTVLGLFVVMQIALAQAALSPTASLPSVLTLAEAVALIVIGNYLPKTEPNWIFGVRTPWTLSSDLAWHKTHRLAGPLMVASGAITIPAASVSTRTGTLTLITCLIAIALVSSIYSYLVWRTDPARDHS